MKTEFCPTYWAQIHIAGPIEVAKQYLRQECMREGLCVTVEPTTFIYTGGEEAGVVVTLRNYPRFPTGADSLTERARTVMLGLVEAMFQHSAMLTTPAITEWVSRRPASIAPTKDTQ